MLQSFWVIDRIYTICYGVYMKRYQVYLNPNSVAVLDNFEGISNISRSSVIRQIIDKISDQLIRVAMPRNPVKGTSILDQMAGFVDLKTNKKTNFAQDVDEIYFTD